MDYFQQIFTAACLLMMRVPQYRRYTLEDLERLLLPPIVLGQCKLYLDEDNKPLAFCSWARLSEGARDGFLARTRKIQPDDWNSGDELWFMDFIAPNGNVRGIIEDLYKLHPGQVGHFARSHGTGKVQRVGRFNNAHV